MRKLAVVGPGSLKRKGKVHQARAKTSDERKKRGNGLGQLPKKGVRMEKGRWKNIRPGGGTDLEFLTGGERKRKKRKKPDLEWPKKGIRGGEKLRTSSSVTAHNW